MWIATVFGNKDISWVDLARNKMILGNVFGGDSLTDMVERQGIVTLVQFRVPNVALSTTMDLLSPNTKLLSLTGTPR